MYMYILYMYILHRHWSEVGSVLPVHPYAVEDDGEADVEDEVDADNK